MQEIFLDLYLHGYNKTADEEASQDWMCDVLEGQHPARVAESDAMEWERPVGRFQLPPLASKGQLQVYQTLRELDHTLDYALHIIADTFLLPWEQPSGKALSPGHPQCYIIGAGTIATAGLVLDVGKTTKGSILWQHPLQIHDMAGRILAAEMKHDGFRRDLWGLLGTVLHLSYQEWIKAQRAG